MFSKVLIANRGEITVRIAQTLREMGIGTVVVYSEPDRGARHVAAGDEAYPLAGVTSAETYLRGDAIIEIAREHGVEAIHPGYGFLAENADFAQACADAGLVFIGPSPAAIRAMGDKLVAKSMMAAAGVPVVPSAAFENSGGGDPVELAAGIGYPVLVKAAAGGGGKGMRVVETPDALVGAIEAARREAGAAFGDPRVFLEKYIGRGQHVEFQVFGDTHGNVVHLFERECSVQRRHQKIIEESPAPGLAPDVRERMGDAAVRAARAVDYTNAGTVEFMLDGDDAFYFLEMNTRLQVEHPVTEMTADRDLVRAQLVVAAGEPLPFTADELRSTGHAMECRVYAEDPARGFLPSTGVIERYEAPTGPGIRVDSGVAAGSAVTMHYDPMLAKLIVRARTRAETIARMRAALDRFVVLGVSTNIDFLRAILDHEAFSAGAVHTRFLEEHTVMPEAHDATPPEALLVAALGAAGVTAAARPDAASDGDDPSPWNGAGSWRVV